VKKIYDSTEEWPQTQRAVLLLGQWRGIMPVVKLNEKHKRGIKFITLPRFPGEKNAFCERGFVARARPLRRKTMDKKGEDI
jgi:hypothetical protein